MATRLTRRLPGFRFEVQSPPATGGRCHAWMWRSSWASRPLDRCTRRWPWKMLPSSRPSSVSTPPWSGTSSEGCPVKAYLAPVVRSFFHNGGRRCWVVRVAGDEAHSNVFPIPGLVMATLDAEGQVAVTPAFAQARSEGSWSDVLRVSATLFARPVAVTGLVSGGQAWSWHRKRAETLPLAICYV